MASKTSIAQAAQAVVTDTVAAMGLDLVDVEYVREGSAWFLRFFLDKRGGITLDDCAAASRAIDPLLDEKLDIPDTYFLEVSSPGLERPLKKPADFHRYMGGPVEVTLYKARNGLKRFEGELAGYDDHGTLTIRTPAGEETTFTREETARVKRAVRI